MIFLNLSFRNHMIPKNIILDCEYISSVYNIPIDDLFRLYLTEQESDDHVKPQKRCQYVFTKGKEKGTTCNRIANKCYCTKHSQYETTGQVFKKVTPQFYKKKPPKILLEQYDGRYFLHRKTGLVFNSNKIVFGYVCDGNIVELTEQYKDICKQYRFKYCADDQRDHKNDLNE